MSAATMSGSGPKQASAPPSTARAGRRQGALEELDPELVKLPRRRTKIGPVLGLAIVALCAISAFRLRGDLVFARQGETPRPLDAAGLAAADDEAFAAVDARPDRSAMLYVFASRARDGHRLMPVIGAGGRAWLMIGGEPARDAAGDDGERYVGRVRRLGDLPFFDGLRARLAATPPVPTVIDADALRAALTARTATVAAATGEAMPVAPDAEVAVAETVADRALVTAAATATHADELAWRAALARAGVLDATTAPVGATDASWTYEVAAPAGVDGVAAALVAAKLYAARATPKVVRHAAPYGTLGATDGGLEIAGAVVPWTSAGAGAITVAARRAPPAADARVLIAGERPADYWYVLPLVLVFAAFAVLFAWGAVRALRAAAAAAPPPAAGASS